MDSATQGQLDELVVYAKAAAARALAHPADFDAVIDTGRGYVCGALTTLSQLGLLTDAEGEEWRDRLLGELPPPNWIGLHALRASSSIIFPWGAPENRVRAHHYEDGDVVDVVIRSDDGTTTDQRVDFYSFFALRDRTYLEHVIDRPDHCTDSIPIEEIVAMKLVKPACERDPSEL